MSYPYPSPPPPEADDSSSLQARRAAFAEQLDRLGEAMLEGWGEPERLEDDEP